MVGTLRAPYERCVALWELEARCERGRGPGTKGLKVPPRGGFLAHSVSSTSDCTSCATSWHVGWYVVLLQVSGISP